MYFTFTEEFGFYATKWMDEKSEKLPRDTNVFNPISLKKYFDHQKKTEYPIK